MVNPEGNPDLMLEVVSIDRLVNKGGGVQISSGTKIGLEGTFQNGFWLITIRG